MHPLIGAILDDFRYAVGLPSSLEQTRDAVREAAQPMPPAPRLPSVLGRVEEAMRAAGACAEQRLIADLGDEYAANVARSRTRTLPNLIWIKADELQDYSVLGRERVIARLEGCIAGDIEAARTESRPVCNIRHRGLRVALAGERESLRRLLAP